mgnify:CR=1 FL=1
MKRLDVTGPHNPSDAMVAIGPSRIAEIAKDPWCSVYSVAYGVGHYDQTK